MLDGLDTAVGDGDTLVILPAMAGGAAAEHTNLGLPGKDWRRQASLSVEPSTFEGSQMSDPIKFARVLRPRSVAMAILAGAVGLAVAAVGGLAVAKTFTLNVATNVKVVNFNTRRCHPSRPS